VAPTFRETDHVRRFLESWEASGRDDVTIHLANAAPGDATSEVVAGWKGRCAVREAVGDATMFWTGLARLGLGQAASEADDGDPMVLMNIDVRFEGDPAGEILAAVKDWRRKQVALPVVAGAGRVVSAGVRVRSWALSLNRHLLDGAELSALSPPREIEATYLPTRFLLFPAEVIRRGCLPDDRRLPHYCADYEYTNRLRRLGFAPVVYTGAFAFLSEENTGFDTYRGPTNLWSRLKRAFDIKCPYHLLYRYRFVRLTYPWPAFLPGLTSHFAKIGLEILLGGKQLESIRLR